MRTKRKITFLNLRTFDVDHNSSVKNPGKITFIQYNQTYHSLNIDFLILTPEKHIRLINLAS